MPRHEGIVPKSPCECDGSSSLFLYHKSRETREPLIAPSRAVRALAPNYPFVPFGSELSVPVHGAEGAAQSHPLIGPRSVICSEARPVLTRWSN